MSENIRTIIRPADQTAFNEAGELLRQGKLVAFPTETVYGLGADATNGTAVAGIYAAKGRPKFNPLIVHVTDRAMAERYVTVPDLASRLMEAFWPGPLTLVLPRKPGCTLTPLVSAGLDTAAIRCPSHPVARAVIAASDRPLAAPSANRSGKMSPTTCDHVATDLSGRVAMIVDGGQTEIGVESTVIGFHGGRAALLRPGGMPRAAIEEITGPLMAPEAGVISSPGQLSSHYAPNAKVRLNATTLEADECLLAFGPNPPECRKTVCNLSLCGDVTEAAANLFVMLHKLDKIGATRIAVMPIPNTGLGEAINDRLHRAAAPRPEDPANPPDAHQ